MNFHISLWMLTCALFLAVNKSFYKGNKCSKWYFHYLNQQSYNVSQKSCINFCQVFQKFIIWKDFNCWTHHVSHLKDQQRIRNSSQTAESSQKGDFDFIVYSPSLSAFQALTDVSASFGPGGALADIKWSVCL